MEKDGSDFVQACYRDILHRDADAEGLASHLDALARGVSKAEIVASLANSDEACLNNMATSQLAKSARRRAFQDKSVLAWPLRKIVAPIVEKKWSVKMGERRAALLEQVSAAPAQAPIGTQQAVETIRVAMAGWRDQMAKSRALHNKDRDGRKVNNFWFDLTTTLQWTGGVVGIVRAELEMACGLAKLYPDLRFSMQIDQGFAEISRDELRWLLDADNITDAYMRFFGRYKDSTEPSQSIQVLVPDVEGFFHPYEDGDSIMAVGWMDSQKERFFSLLKNDLSRVHLFYLVYDIILLLEGTRHFYVLSGRERFERYVDWISHNCDMIFYGGRTAQIDTEALQRERGWPTPPGVPVKFGTDIVRSPDTLDDKTILRNLGITGEYIITVGSLEPRKNHETLYRAYLLATEIAGADLPQLIFIGKPMWRVDDMMDTIARDPRIAGKLLCLTPTDIELSVLYKHCRFTLLPSLYEGWSLTLPESLGQGKFCLCSDTPPLREIGGDLVDYVNIHDVRAWAEKIILYSRDNALLQYYESKISSEWPTMRWSDTAQSLLDAALAFTPGQVEDGFNEPPVIWMDLTLSFLDWGGGISGIVRSELEFARRLKALDPRTKFFAYQRYNNGDYFFQINEGSLLWLFDNTDLSEAYKNFQEFWSGHENDGTGYRDPFRYPEAHGRPQPGHEAYLSAIPSNSIVFFAGIDFNIMSVGKIGDFIRPDRGIMRSQLIYDLTPILTPQFHLAATCDNFRQLFDYVSNNFEHIVYGGRTAQRDGMFLQKRDHLAIPASNFVEFGSDISAIQQENTSEERDAQVLHSLGIDSDFAITVGTIEPRKNHEALYKAYLLMLQQGLLDKPFQIIFVGRKGWKSDDFLASLEQDDRVRGRILIMSPSDEELDVLYRHCKFTLLPSFYEGWSLTLPESLSYGKLCLTSDVDPLKETGRDLVEYIHPLDTALWAERIAFYANNPGQVEAWERKIKAQWNARTWRESADMLLGALRHAHGEMVAAQKSVKKTGEHA